MYHFYALLRTRLSEDPQLIAVIAKNIETQNQLSQPPDASRPIRSARPPRMSRVSGHTGGRRSSRSSSPHHRVRIQDQSDQSVQTVTSGQQSTGPNNEVVERSAGTVAQAEGTAPAEH